MDTEVEEAMPSYRVEDGSNEAINGGNNGSFTKDKEHMKSPDGTVGDSFENARYNEKGTVVNGAVEVPVTVPPEKDDKAKEKKKEKPPMVGVMEVFRFSNAKDRVIIFFGILCACLHGAAMPLMCIVFGDVTDSFVDDGNTKKQLDELAPLLHGICLNTTSVDAETTCQNLNSAYLGDHPDFLKSSFIKYMPDGAAQWDKIEHEKISEFMNNMTTYCVYFALIGVGVLLFGYLQMLTWCTAAYNQSQRIRTTLFRSILRQEIGWFDVHEIGELNNRLNDDVGKIEVGIGEKLALFFQWFTSFVVGFIIGFIYGWKLTLVIISVSPLLALCGVAMGMSGTAFTKKELAAYAKAGDIAQEALGAIRTVVAFGGQKKELARYNVNLQEARDFGMRKGMINGLAMGGVFLVMFACYSLAFWYGSSLVRSGEYTAGGLLIVFFGVLIGAFSLGNAAPNIQEFFSGRGAAYTVYNIIDQIPSIDSSSPDGAKLERVQGNVQFDGVHFSYPSRESVKVLQSLSLRVDVGQTVALVGSSGCGKSTVVQLIQRFYDPLQGTVFVDGTDIRTLNVEWLRQQIGVVSQEPILFGCSIAQNISYGQKGCSMEDIKNAAVNANAADFIDTLPDKYETLVGERGAQLSGGQKQRIAIARALVRNPKILLLDEATSALDTESEATVQAALDKARLGRTTIIVAHRLSTIRTADLIFGFRDGQVVESGSHEELMTQGGVYCQLVTNQQAKVVETDDSLEGEDEFEDDKPEDVPLSHSVTGLERRQSSRGSGRKLHRGLSSDSYKAGAPKGDEADEEKPPEPSMMKIMKLNRPEWLYIAFGCFCAIIAGGVQPAFAIIFAELMGVFALTDMAEMERQCNLYSLLFLVIGIVAGLAMLGMATMFAKSGEMLTERVRQLTFKTMLGQDIAYFDDHKNNTGALCTRLSTDASAVQGATGARLSTFFQSMASIGTGIVIGFVYSWQMTLLVLGFVPFMMIAGVIQMKVISGSAASNKQAMESAGKVAVEAMENIRTVATLTKEDKFQEDYRLATEVPFKQNRRKAHLQGAAYGFSQGVIFFAYAAAFYLGAYLVENKMIEFQNVFKVLFAIVFGALAAGQASSFAPDYGKAKAAAASIFHLINRELTINSYSEEGSKLGSVSGLIELNDVCFTYPTRKDTEVLKGVSLRVEPGQRVALVGSSGCGKSTTVQLLERFYDSSQGTVTLDGQALPSLHLQWLRSQMGIVSQEPVLFDYSIRDNIAYGDNSREVSMQEVQEAAMKSNIHSFITSLPEGYETRVGDKGTQLSGGQKQRVAIARALVRNPKILLLDEATSALDTESEKVVQEALDRAQEGRTCLVIAHRLSTIRNADLIVVIHKGRIEETGTHAELTAKKGIYYKLNNMQAKS